MSKPRLEELIFQRDKGICAKCKKKPRRSKKHPKRPWEADHILPYALGGSDSLENFQTLCRRCHWLKTLEDLKRIRREWNPLVALRHNPVSALQWAAVYMEVDPPQAWMVAVKLLNIALQDKKRK